MAMTAYLSQVRLRGMAESLRYALDPVAFAIERLAWQPDHWQATVLRAPDKNVLLNCSRQAGKSTATAVISLHCALYRPGSLILLVSPTDRQSKNLFNKVVDFMRRLKEKPTLKEDNIHSLTFDSGSRIISLPGSNADTIRGYSAPALVVLDEAAYINDELYTALRPMLAVSRGRFMMLSTPNGKRGAFYDAWSGGDDQWRRIEVKAPECPRIDPKFLEQESAALGDLMYKQEYLCEFIATVDQFFSEDAIQRAFANQGEPQFTSVPAAAPEDELPLFTRGLVKFTHQGTE